MDTGVCQPQTALSQEQNLRDGFGGEKAGEKRSRRNGDMAGCVGGI